MAAKARKKTVAKRPAKKATSRAKTRLIAKKAKRGTKKTTRTSAAAKSPKALKSKPSARNPSKPSGIPQKVAEAFHAVVDTMSEATHMRDKMKGPPGPEDG